MRGQRTTGVTISGSKVTGSAIRISIDPSICIKVRGYARGRRERH
jgi:hypothetical protein